MIDAAKLLEMHKINASPEQIRLLQAYVSMLLDENTRQNLTAVKTEEEVWKRHILDAAMLQGRHAAQDVNAHFLPRLLPFGVVSANAGKSLEDVYLGK